MKSENELNTDRPKLTLSETINWVSELHDNQYRKGTYIPYISHPFGVMTLLLKNGIIDEEILKVALLHDTLEDTDIDESEIVDVFGLDIRDFVAFLSEDKSKSWDQRKNHTINHIDDMPIQSKLVLLADKVNNLEMMKTEIDDGGIDWNKCNKGYKHQEWYYRRVIEKIALDEDIAGSALLKYSENLLESVFNSPITNN